MGSRFIPPQFLDQLRSRVSISSVIGNFVDLKPKPGGEFMGLCPFHNEKTPSFTVSDQKGFYHCFGCGAHGDIVRFMIENRGLTFTAAVEELANQAGLEMPKMDAAEQKKYERAQTLYDVMEAACVWFEEQLRLNSAAAARDYLVNRGISQQQRRTFRLGYAPDSWDGLKNALTEKGIREDLIKAAGLVTSKEGGKTYDRFRGRLMFPISDNSGRIIAFGGRILGDGEPKYLNSPETELFFKGKTLYSMHIARPNARNKGQLIASEGYMDIIAMHKAGFDNAVAPLGTAITEDHIQQMWQVVDEPILCMDGDNAGKRAMIRAMHVALPHLKPGKSLQFAMLPVGKDPDDVINQSGKEAFNSLINKALSLSELLWQSVFDDIKPNTPEQWAKLERSVNQFIGKIQDQSVRQYYQRYVNDKLWQSRRHKPGQKTAKKPMQNLQVSLPDESQNSYPALMCGLILANPSLLQDAEVENALETLDIPENMQPLLDKLNEASQKNADIIHKNNAFLLDDPAFHTHISEMIERFLGTAVRNYEDANQAITAWKYMVGMYEWTKIEGEYQSASNNAQLNVEALWELKKQKDALKMQADIAKGAFEAMVAD